MGTTFRFREPVDDWDAEAFVAAEGYTIDYTATVYDVGAGHTGYITLALNESLTLVQRISFLSKVEDLGAPEDGSAAGRGTTYNYWALGLGSALDGVAWQNDSGKFRAVNLTGLARVQGDSPIVADDFVTLGSLPGLVTTAVFDNVLLTVDGGLVYGADGDLILRG
jgi:hypothetical protein